jgi:trimethylamine--corrinoid protein Co-methyltransferase
LNAGGVNSPATIAGCMASMNAGILLGVVLSQLVRQGAPIAVPGWNGGPYNLKTMVGNYVLADEQGVPTSMGKHYDLPVFGLGGCTDGKVLDHQAGMECTISLMTALLHGANIVHDVGFMDSGLQGSLQIQVMANETIGFLRAATRGVVVDDETLALDAIDEVGPTGSFLQHAHTMRHYKAPFYSTLFDKGPYSQWEKNGRLTLEDKAAQAVDRILATHTAESLPEEVQEKIKAIVKREQEWIDRQSIKNVFWLNIFVGFMSPILDILQYACGVKHESAAILSQNPIFKKGPTASVISIKAIVIKHRRTNHVRRQPFFSQGTLGLQ